MLKFPFFSIIIPVYNVENYLEQCLDSIINQSFTDFEVILVNDGSTDESLKICESFTSIHQQIKLINQENKGLSGARNSGFNMASGKYIWFVDSDDYIKDNSLEILFNQLSNSYLDVLGFSNYHFIEETQMLRENNINSESSILNNLELLDKKLLFEIAPWIYVYKYSFLKENDIHFREDIKIHEDEFYLIEVLSKLNSIKFIEDKIYVYRIRANSLMRSNRKLEKLYVFSQLIDYFIELKNKNYLTKDFWNSKIYNTIQNYYVLFFEMKKEHISRAMQSDFNRVKSVKLGIIKNDPFGIIIMKLLHNFCFPVYKKILLK
jgi:glycosyltransferase involved in cell wall biosynthesis